MRQVHQGDYTLEHSIVPGVFGEPKNAFNITRRNADGSKTVFPIIEPIKVTSYARNTPLFQIAKFTDEELATLLAETIPTL